MKNKNPYADHIKQLDTFLVKIKSRISMLEKRRNAVARMKRVVKGGHWADGKRWVSTRVAGWINSVSKHIK